MALIRRILSESQTNANAYGAITAARELRHPSRVLQQANLRKLRAGSLTAEGLDQSSYDIA